MRSTRRGFLQRAVGTVGGVSTLCFGAVGTAASVPSEYEIQLDTSEQAETEPFGTNTVVDIQTDTDAVNIKAVGSVVGTAARADGALFGTFTPPATAEYSGHCQYVREGVVNNAAGSGEAAVSVFAREVDGESSGAPLETIQTDVSGTVTQSGRITLRKGVKYHVGVIFRVRVTSTVAEPFALVDFFDGDRRFEVQDFRLQL